MAAGVWRRLSSDCPIMSKSTFFKQLFLSGAILPLAVSCSQPEAPIPDVLESYLVDHSSKPQYEKGYDAYFDLSDGLLSAYQVPGISNCLKSVVNKITGNADCDGIFTLKNSEIAKCELRQTDLYNYILAPASYQMIAPIEQSLAQITGAGRAALFVTDFEEYSGGVIQQQNYAKQYFIDWLSRGNRIVFFVFDYKEGAKAKHLYFTVFDTPEHLLLKDVELALEGNGATYATFRLGNGEVAFSNSYASSTVGGSYHDAATGEDIISLTKEDGEGDCYARFEALNAEFYPFMESMPNIVQNIADAKEPGSDYTPAFSHLLSGLKADFSAMSGYDVKRLDVRVSDIQDDYDTYAGFYELKSDSVAIAVLPDSAKGRVTDVPDAFVFAGSVSDGVADIAVDFRDGFKGQSASFAEGDLLRVDVVMAECAPRYDVLPALFEWDGNRSLIEAVKNTLQAQNPQGRVVYSYFIKCI